MNRLSVSAAKAIAAGDAGDNYLRATIILTPPADGDAKMLARWPGAVIRWLGGKENQWRLKLAVEPVTDENDRPCSQSQNEIMATASAMQTVWSHQADTAWVDELWAEAFKCYKGDTAGWTRLAKVLNRATSHDDMFKGAANAGGICSVPQTELSLLLECNRALELCDSIKGAYLATRDERVSNRQEEIKYLFLQQEKPKEPCATEKPARDLADRGSLAEQMASHISCCQKAGVPENQVVNDSRQAKPEPTDPTMDPCEEAELDRIGQIFYSLQSSPTLSRLFGLAIDVKFQASELRDKIADAPFLYLSVSTAAYDTSHPPILTLTEYHPETPSYFWPATREEMSRRSVPIRRIDGLSQYHGIPVTWQKNEEGSGHPRFELSCLDVRRATESATDRQAIVDLQNDRNSDPSHSPLNMTDEQLREWARGQLCKPAVNSPCNWTDDQLLNWAKEQRLKLTEDKLCKLTEKRLCELTAESPLRPAAFARKTYHTAGFTILDLGREKQAQSQLDARVKQQKQKQCNSSIYLDAGDLLTGYRIDVGVPSRTVQQKNCIDDDPASHLFTWRGVMARKVVYGVTGSHSNRIQSVAPHLFLENAGSHSVDPDFGWQKCLEDGYLGLTARLNTQEKSTFDAYVEEAIFTWTGEPAGVLVPGQRKHKVKPDCLPCGRVVIAPNSQTDASRRIPFLRFGCHYRLGLRSVYPGGISLPLGVAAGLYNSEELGAALTVPASPPADAKSAVRVRRFLRHERIDAPLLLLPEDAALRRHGPMGYESAARAVIRSVHGSLRNRQQPTLTQRVFVAPGVAHSLAGMHGVFDQVALKHPMEGLSSSRFGPYGVRRDPDRGGFPMVKSDHITGINGFPYPSFRRITSSSPGDEANIGDLFYSIGPHPKPNRQSTDYMPYYPDPAVRYFVIAVRSAGSDVYLDGEPCVIDACGKGYNYPDTRPLVVTLQRTPAARPRSSFPRLDEVVTLPKGNGRVAHLPAGAIRIPGAVEALISLAPGDDFEVDVWCIPEVGGLAKQFELIELLAALALYKGQNQSKQSKPADKFSSGLSQLLPYKFCQIAKSYLPRSEDSDCQKTGTGPGGLTVPGPIVRQAVAHALVDVLKKRPLDEIAAVRTLRATHATDQPFAFPRLVDAPKKQSGESRPVGLNRTAGSQTNRYPYTPQGMIEFDWATTSSLEIGADMASPSSDQIDNVQRGRAIRDRRLGRWPHLNGSPLNTSEVYGFDVAPDGEVTLPKTCGITLYRLDDIPLPNRENVTGIAANNAEVPPHLLFDQFFCKKDKKLNVGTGKFTFQFTDGLARQLNLRVTAFSRHRDQMRTADPIARNGKWLHQGEPLAAADASRASACVPVWLEACVRPAEPAARTPIPAFRWSEEIPSRKLGKGRRKPAPVVHQVSRTVIVRIPIARPWFSSGEDERLGIVLWPPDFFSQPPEMFENDQIWFKGSCKDEKGNTNQGRIMKLIDFQDEDLGPGGKFITRWGGDPTRFPAERLTPSAPPPRCQRSFIPASAFLDLSQDTGTGFIPELVCRASMPIRVEESTSKPDDEKSGDIPTLDVSLLTYRPKFDISEEQWYVDVALEHSREAEPFVRLGLVRYQPHAREDLRVSYPIVQWTQLLPRRTVEVRRSGLAVTIRVEGLATSPKESLTEWSLKASDNPKEPLSSDRKERFPTARMTACVIREANLPLGVATRRRQSVQRKSGSIEEEIIFSEENTCYTRLNEGIYQAVWEETFTLIEMNLKHANYFVIVEERDLRLPATYVSEPVSPQRAIGKNYEGILDDGLLVESGLRFATKIPI